LDVIEQRDAADLRIWRSRASNNGRLGRAKWTSRDTGGVFVGVDKRQRQREAAMPGIRRKALLFHALALGFALVVAAAVPAAATADGLPVLGVDVGSEGVAARTSPIRYVTLHGGRETMVARTAVEGGRVLGFARLPGNFTIPAVAYDGSASGLSADAGTLVLIQPRLKFPRARTALAILDAKPLRLRKLITLPGDFSFDAVSPSGSTLFLIQYISARDPTRYRVRAYDLRSQRLVANPIVDPHERGAMRGSPITRATSSDGRWAYTLYDGAGGTPFLHALDTSKRQARCIDLPMLTGRQDLGQLRITIASDRATLTVGIAGQKLALVDTRDLRASAPAKPTASKPSQTVSHSDRTWLFLGVAALATVLAASTLSLALRRRRTRLAPTA
jgi:hypothetical protein